MNTTTESRPRKTKRRVPGPPPLPFVPFHAVALSEEDIRRALAGRSEEYAVRAVMQIISGEMWSAVHGMAGGDETARGEFRALQGLYGKIEQLVRREV